MLYEPIQDFDAMLHANCLICAFPDDFYGTQLWDAIYSSVRYQILRNASLESAFTQFVDIHRSMAASATDALRRSVWDNLR